MVCSHKQRFGEIVEFKVASNQTKLKKGEEVEQEEQEERVQLKEQGEDMQLEGQGEEVQLKRRKDIWQETGNEEQESKDEQPESEKQK